MGTRYDEHTPLLRDGEEADDREVSWIRQATQDNMNVQPDPETHR